MIACGLSRRALSPRTLDVRQIGTLDPTGPDVEQIREMVLVPES